MQKLPEQQKTGQTLPIFHQVSPTAIKMMSDDVDDDDVAISSAEQCLGEAESLLESYRPPPPSSGEKARRDGRPTPGPAKRKRKRKSLDSDSDSDDDDNDDDDYEPEPRQLRRRTMPPGTPERKQSGKD